MAQRFRFGLFEFDGSVKELRREGTVVRLPAQPAQVLACLLEGAGEVVSRENLRRAVWHDDTFVDFERGLNFCIAQIRTALDDDATAPRFIRTIPKRGYQFIAPVDNVGEAAARPAAQSGTQAATPVMFAGWRMAAIATMLLAVFAAGYWFHARSNAIRTPIVAVARFDNETGDAQMNGFSDALTDTLITDLTGAGDGRYRVIGNARILRLPRDQRDLTALASSLGASYVVLGQVQLSGSQVRILAHLIHLPEQTHVWVARMDRATDDPLAVESEVAQNIAAQFSPRIAAHRYAAMASYRAPSD